jgi:hypothetical protein
MYGKAKSESQTYEFWRQFHQHLTQAFYIRKQITQLSLGTFQLCNFWRKNFVQKMGA